MGPHILRPRDSEGGSNENSAIAFLLPEGVRYPARGDQTQTDALMQIKAFLPQGKWAGPLEILVSGLLKYPEVFHKPGKPFHKRNGGKGSLNLSSNRKGWRIQKNPGSFVKYQPDLRKDGNQGSPRNLSSRSQGPVLRVTQLWISSSLHPSLRRAVIGQHGSHDHHLAWQLDHTMWRKITVFPDASPLPSKAVVPCGVILSPGDGTTPSERPG